MFISIIKMSEYYTRILEVKHQVIQQPDILTKIIEHYDYWYNGGKLILKQREAVRGRNINGGNTREAYSLGMLESGLWLAHKIYRIESDAGKTFEDGHNITLEGECQGAEDLFNKGKRVPYFHMVVMHDGIGSILTEDVTKGGNRKTYGGDIDFVWIQTEKGGRAKVYVDFKWYFHLPEEYRYCSKEAVLIV